jgi:hypothetical protein
MEHDDMVGTVVKIACFLYESSQAVPARPSGNGRLKRRQEVPKCRRWSEQGQKLSWPHCALSEFCILTLTLGGIL